MSMIALEPTRRSPLTAIPSAPASHSSSTSTRTSRAVDERVDAGAAGVAVLELEGEARPGDGDQARRRGAPPPARRTGGGGSRRRRDPGPRGRRSAGAAPRMSDLERLLLRLQPERGLDQRRPLLRRVADARALGGDLRGDQEAEDEQRHGERDLDARQRTEARDERAHRSIVGGSPVGARRVLARLIRLAGRRLALSVGAPRRSAAGAGRRGSARGPRQRARRRAGRPRARSTPGRIGPGEVAVPPGAIGRGRRDRAAARAGSWRGRRVLPPSPAGADRAAPAAARTPAAPRSRGRRASPPRTPATSTPSAAVNASSSLTPSA